MFTPVARVSREGEGWPRVTRDANRDRHTWAQVQAENDRNMRPTVQRSMGSSRAGIREGV
jgi:hypothetical protein